MNAKEIKAAVDEQYLLAKLILNDLPSNILIGPYHVQVESVRQKLSKKHKQLGEAILELLVQKLRGQGDAACDLCKSISRKLNEKPGMASNSRWWRLIHCIIPILWTISFMVHLEYNFEAKKSMYWRLDWTSWVDGNCSNRTWEFNRRSWTCCQWLWTGWRILLSFKGGFQVFGSLWLAASGPLVVVVVVLIISESEWFENLLKSRRF